MSTYTEAFLKMFSDRYGVKRDQLFFSVKVGENEHLFWLAESTWHLIVKRSLSDNKWASSELHGRFNWVDLPKDAGAIEKKIMNLQIIPSFVERGDAAYFKIKYPDWDMEKGFDQALEKLRLQKKEMSAGICVNQ